MTSTSSVHDRLHVCVLLGGETREREVSLHSGSAFGQALLRRGHRVLFLDPASGFRQEAAPGSDCSEVPERFGRATADRRRMPESLAGLQSDPVDLCAILLHGGAGEGGVVQGILDLLGLPYTGSDATSSAVALDKILSKRLMEREGIPLAKDFLWRAAARPTAVTAGAAGGTSPEETPPAPSATEIRGVADYPLVVKPIAGGSTVGVTILKSASDWPEAWMAARDQIDPRRGLMVEEFIPGRELTVGILRDQALPVVEIVPKTGFYDYRRKYTKGETEYRVPAPVSPEVSDRLRELALTAYHTLGCRDMARVDFRLTPEGRAACLEVNTIPGMTATSLLPMAAKAVGIEFDELAEILCREACTRGRS